MRRLAMTSTIRVPLLAFATLLAAGFAAPAQAQQANMTFFITSAGPGKGGDLGGLDGADAHCQALAQAAGAGGKTWRAYLSDTGRQRGQRQGPHRRGPVAERQGHRGRQDVADLHSANNNLNKETALSEKGEVINGRGDTPNRHDILTGSQADGTAFTGGDDRTCGNWTKSSAGAAMVGHHDRTGLNDEPPAMSWNSSHPSRGPDGGCSQATCAAPAATGCSTASRPTNATPMNATAGRKPGRLVEGRTALWAMDPLEVKFYRQRHMLFSQGASHVYGGSDRLARRATGNSGFRSGSEV